MDEVYASLIANDMVVSKMTPQNPLENAYSWGTDFCKVVGYKINSEYIIAFLYINDILRKKIRDTILFTMSSKL